MSSKLKASHITFQIFDQEHPIDMERAIDGFGGDELTFYNWLQNFFIMSINNKKMKQLIIPYETNDFKRFSQLI